MIDQTKKSKKLSTDMILFLIIIVILVLVVLILSIDYQPILEIFAFLLLPILFGLIIYAFSRGSATDMVKKVNDNPIVYLVFGLVNILIITYYFEKTFSTDSPAILLEIALTIFNFQSIIGILLLFCIYPMIIFLERKVRIKEFNESILKKLFSLTKYISLFISIVIIILLSIIDLVLIIAGIIHFIANY